MKNNTSPIPTYVNRIFLFKTILGYKIKDKKVRMSGARIASFNYIMVDNFTMVRASHINKINRVKNRHTLKLNERSGIYDHNFIGGSPNGKGVDGVDFKEQKVFLRKDTAVNRRNFFDVVLSIFIGDNVVFGGNGSETWIHGFDTKRNRPVRIVEFEDNNFIGSNCAFTKRVVVCNGVSKGQSFTVNKSISRAGVYSTHKLERVKLYDCQSRIRNH